jgi:hypothetical protein
MALFHAAKAFFQKHPLVSNCCIYGTLYVVSQMLVVVNGKFHFSPAWQEKGERKRDNDYGIIRGSSQGKICCFACGADVSLMLSRLIFIFQGAEFSQQTITRKFLVS